MSIALVKHCGDHRVTFGHGFATLVAVEMRADQCMCNLSSTIRD